MFFKGYWEHPPGRPLLSGSRPSQHLTQNPPGWHPHLRYQAVLFGGQSAPLQHPDVSSYLCHKLAQAPAEAARWVWTSSCLALAVRYCITEDDRKCFCLNCGSLCQTEQLWATILSVYKYVEKYGYKDVLLKRNFLFKSKALCLAHLMWLVCLCFCPVAHRPTENMKEVCHLHHTWTSTVRENDKKIALSDF